jgi:hypothetical protein
MPPRFVAEQHRDHVKDRKAGKDRRHPVEAAAKRTDQNAGDERAKGKRRFTIAMADTIRLRIDLQ